MLAPPATRKTDLGGGAFVLQSPEPLAPYARCVGEWLEQWARDTPGATAVAERVPGGGWRSLDWRGLRQRVGAVAQSLLDLGLAPAKPIAVLSDNAIDHLVLMLAGMHIGHAVCSVSSGYCRLAQGDYSRLHGILRALDPALVYASDAATYAPGLHGAGIDAALVFSQGAESQRGALSFAQLTAAVETPAVERAFAGIGPDTHAGASAVRCERTSGTCEHNRYAPCSRSHSRKSTCD